MFSPEIIDAIKAHAIREYPNESCGVVTTEGYVECRNISSEPKDQWRIDPQEFMAIKNVLAVVHSHPDGPLGPSAADMRQQLASGYAFGIVVCNGEAAMEPFFWGGDIPTPPIIGREFRHGPSGSDNKGDCYALVRDWYRLEMKIDLPEIPRDDNWWKNGEDLYGEFRKHGFRKIAIEEIRHGDGILAQVRSDVPNHAGIYVGNGLILHHLVNQLSRREPVGRWHTHILHVLRHENCAS